MAAPERKGNGLPEDKTFAIHNRKYLGSKYRLLDFIARIILPKTGRIGTFIDGFSGTGVVAHHFRPYAEKVIANDILYANYVVGRAFLTSTEENVDLKRVGELLDCLNGLQGKSGYVFRNYGGTYFTHENAGLIDAVREGIEELRGRGRCTEQEYYLLLASLIFAMDKVANTVGQYDAYLKHLGRESYTACGKHCVDYNVYKRLQLKRPSVCFGGKAELYNEDLNELIGRVRGDILYLDPPYNTRQYIDCYHVLENVVRWEKPVLYGKTKKFERGHLKSSYSRKGDSERAFRDLIARAEVSHIAVSYNSEGIIPDAAILEALRGRGEVEVFTEKYSIFGNGAGKSVKREIRERLFYCRVAR